MKNTIKLVSIILSLCSLVKADNWEIISNMPVPVKGAQAVVHNTTIYIIGGFSDSLLTGTKLIQAYYPNSNTWKILEDSLVVPRYGLSAHIYKEEVLIYGGASTATDSSYGIESWGFSGKPEIKSFDFNFNRKFSSSVIDGDYLYIFGGYPDFQLFDSLYYCVQFHIPSGEVIDTFSINDSYNFDNIPYLQMSAIVEDQIYLFGGVFNVVLQSINTFGLDDKQWKSGNVSLIEKRAGAAILNITAYNQIVLIGGLTETSDAMNSVEIFNYGENTIDTSHSLNEERAECTAAIFNDAVFVFGGEDILGKMVGSVEKINLPIGPITTISRTPHKILPQDFENVKNYPNPFNPSTIISLTVNRPSYIEVNIYDIEGKFVKSITSENYKPGHYQFEWDGKNNLLNDVSSGIYFYRISSKKQSETKRMILVR